MKVSKLPPVLILLAVGLLAAETGIRVSQIRAPEIGDIIIRHGAPPFNLHMATLGPSFNLDTSGSTYMLTVSPSPTIKDRISYEVAAPTPEFTIPVDFLVNSLEVHAGGLLMTRPYDFTLTGRTVQFVEKQIPKPGDVVNLQYFPAPF